ncbi:MAG: GIY-YIG nuclease family protein [Elainellaceae cyanobacterium]|jgi:hypothetical protein|uniref:GIY-YIG nuclease family protein n=1 Tax=Leptolyngbya sp. CCY15150 TaxID=2767772 RepID=UPI00195217C7|nr:GIY-YIG nuclease family protein [Leptolyngbya sp. CCY15150]
MSETQPIRLADLDFIPYLTDAGELSYTLADQIGVYAIFDADRTLQFVGYSRNVALSLVQHIVRQPQQCYWVKVQCIDRPSRSILEDIRQAWLAEVPNSPAHTASDRWTQPIDAAAQMTPEEQQALAKGDGGDRPRLLKQVARRVEQEVLAQLAERGVTASLRFNPKLKEEGLLDLK